MDTPITFHCSDGYVLNGHVWEPDGGANAGGTSLGTVVITCATGVKASYYHRYAAFLAENGFTAVTFDYRGIGQSRHGSLVGLRVRWFEWGLRDIDAVLDWALNRDDGGPVSVVGHSFGGFGVGLAANGRRVGRLLTVGAQHAHWRDYRRNHRLRFWWRWHVLMPLLTVRRGYFPGRERGWLEDLPAGVALDWARSPRDFTAVAPRQLRALMKGNQQAFATPTVAVAAVDDPYATPVAVNRTLKYHPNSPSDVVWLHPEDLGEREIGHFGLFHARFRDTFWADSVRWLRDGEKPWK